jgi:peroxin-19
MTDALQGVDGPLDLAKAATASSSSTASAGGDVEEFLQSFMKSFDKAVGSSDDGFDKEITSLMTSMLSKDLVVDPLKQIADGLEPWLKNQKGLSASDRTKYQDMLRLYRKIIETYEQNPDPLPEGPREEVQRLLAELHSLGQPPDEVMQQISPADAQEGDESFEDFMKSMGLDKGLGTAEQDLLKKLSEDPEELTKAMKEMAGGLSDEACKQQ